MSNATVVAGLRTGMEQAAAYGVAKSVSVKRASGAYDPATGQHASSTVVSLTALLYDREATQDANGTPFSKQTAVVVIDDLPGLAEADEFTVDGETWRPHSWDTDPTGSFYEIELRR